MEITFEKSHSKLHSKYLHLVSFAEHKHSFYITTSVKEKRYLYFHFLSIEKKEWQE